MKITGILLILLGVIGLLFDKPSKTETEIEEKLHDVSKPKSEKILLINDRKINLSLIVLGIIFVLLD
ncbi:MAG: hypothetical protein ACPGSB_09400 [Opitutales bacterium]